MRSALEIAREIFPGDSDEGLEYIIWNRTGWPVFWPAGFKTVESALRSQLKAHRRALAGLRVGQQLCTFCSRKARPSNGLFPLCKRCAWVLDEDAE